MRKQRIGLRAEKRLAELLTSYGRSVVRCAYLNPYDLVVDGYRVEVKCASPRKGSSDEALIWKFNIHRHGVLSEGQTDFYILRLEDVPNSKYAIHLLLKSPVGRTTITVSIRSLLNQDWAAAVSDFYALAKGEYGKQKIEAAA